MSYNAKTLREDATRGEWNMHLCAATLNAMFSGSWEWEAQKNLYIPADLCYDVKEKVIE